MLANGTLPQNLTTVLATFGITPSESSYVDSRLLKAEYTPINNRTISNISVGSYDPAVVIWANDNATAHSLYAQENLSASKELITNTGFSNLEITLIITVIALSLIIMALLKKLKTVRIPK